MALLLFFCEFYLITPDNYLTYGYWWKYNVKRCQNNIV